MVVPSSLKLLALSAAIGACLALPSAQVFADDIYFDGTALSWNAPANWTTSDGSSTPDPINVPGAGDDAIFNSSSFTSSATVLLDAGQSAQGLIFVTPSALTLRGAAAGTGQNLNIGADGIYNSAGSTVTIGRNATVANRINVNLMGSQTWTSDGPGALNIVNSVKPNSTVIGITTLTLDGSSASTLGNSIGNTNASTNTSSGIISDGTSSQLKIVKNGSGTWVINGPSSGTIGNPSFTGGITINSGILANGNAPGAVNSAALGTGPITFTGGELRGAGSATYSNQVIVNGNATITAKTIASAGSQTMTFTGAFTSSGTPGNGPTLTFGNAGTNGASISLKGDLTGFNGTFLFPQNSVSTGSGANLVALNGQDANSVDGSNAKWQFDGPGGNAFGTYDNVRIGPANVASGTNGLVYKLGQLSGTGHVWLFGAGTNTQSLEVGALNTNSVFGGNIAGFDQVFGGSDIYNFKKVGTGTFTLSGENAFVGSTSVSNGTLIAGVDSKNITLSLANKNALSLTQLNATTDVFTSSLISGTPSPHGLVADQRVVIDYGLATGDYQTLLGKPLYVVNNADLTATTFQLSLAPGGSPVDFLTSLSLPAAAASVYASGAFGGYNTAINVGDGGASTNNVKLLAGTASNPNVEIGRAIIVADNAGGTSTLGSEVNGNSVFSGAVTLNKDLSLTSASTGANALTVSGVVSSTGAFGLTKIGAGKAILTGNSTYTGTTTVSAGTLLVNGNNSAATGAVNVTGGKLGGTGTIGGSVSLVGGTLAPGASIGTLNIGASVTLTSGTFDWEFSGGPPPGTNAPIGADVLNVAGTLSIASAVSLVGTNFGTNLIGGTKFVAISYLTAGTPGTFNLMPDDSIVVVGGKQWLINYNDTSFAGAANVGQALYGNAVSLTAVPEASSVLVMGLGGAFAIAAVWFGKRCGIVLVK